MIATATCDLPRFTGAPGRSAVDLQIVDPVSYPQWDGLLATHPEATFFHGSSWAGTLAAAYGFQARYVAAIAQDRLYGLLPLMEANSWLAGRRGVSLPFTDECSPLSMEVTADQLFDRALEEGKRRGWQYLEMRGGHGLIDRLPESVSYYSHDLPLTRPLNEIFDRFESRVRGPIRKAERCGVTVRFGKDLDTVRAYYRLHCRTRTKHGAPPQPFRFFQALSDHVLEPGHGFVALAEYRERPIAGAVFFQFGRKALYKFSASDERCQELRGPNLVLWRSVERLVAGGFEELNFGKTSLSNEGLRKFKAGWGSVERMIHYARYSFPKEQFVGLADLAVGFQRRLFAVLPMLLCRCVGRIAYRHLS